MVDPSQGLPEGSTSDVDKGVPGIVLVNGTLRSLREVASDPKEYMSPRSPRVSLPGGVSEDKTAWQLDTTQCSICKSKFGDVLNRRHHCRMCGKCVCHPCSPNLLQMSGNLQRVCNPCVLSGAGALDLLPRLRDLCEKLQRFDFRSSDFPSLESVCLPAEALAECETAIDPLCETFAEAVSQTARTQEELTSLTECASHSDAEMQRLRSFCESTSKELQEEQLRREVAVLRWQEEAEHAERERRARALSDARAEAAERLAEEAEDAEREAIDFAESSREVIDVGMSLAEEELEQERSTRQELEAKLRESMEGLGQLNKLLKHATGAMAQSGMLGAEAASAEASPGAKSRATQDLSKCVEAVESCSAAVAQLMDRQRRGSFEGFAQVSELSSSPLSNGSSVDVFHESVFSSSSRSDGNLHAGHAVDSLLKQMPTTHYETELLKGPAPTEFFIGSFHHSKEVDYKLCLPAVHFAEGEDEVIGSSNGLSPKEYHTVGIGSFPALPSLSDCLPAGQPASAWDDNTADCSICGLALGKRRFRPRHHCRMCGRCVCHSCSPSCIALRNMEGAQRVCTPCISMAVSPRLSRSEFS